MGEYQVNSEFLQSNRTNDTLQQNTPETIHIVDNRSQSPVQRAVQMKLAHGKQVQSPNILQRTGKYDTMTLQGKLNSFQLENGLEEEEPVKKDTQSGNVSQLVEAPTQAGLNSTGLPDNLKSGVENISGFSLDSVHVHYNSDKPAQLQALAYTQGTDIHVAPGQEQHLPHEAWHVVQQMQGRVEPTLEINGNVPVNDDKGLENEADTMGNRANSL
jgi:hypothetical protein